MGKVKHKWAACLFFQQAAISGSVRVPSGQGHPKEWESRFHWVLLAKWTAFWMSQGSAPLSTTATLLPPMAFLGREEATWTDGTGGWEDITRCLRVTMGISRRGHTKGMRLDQPATPLSHKRHNNTKPKWRRWASFSPPLAKLSFLCILYSSLD